MSNVQGAMRRAKRLTRRARVTAHRTLLRSPKRVACPVCGWSGSSFFADGRGWKRLCPQCSSSERDRALALELRMRGPAAPGARLLEVAPIGLVKGLAEELGYEHHSVDLFSPRAEVRGNLCGLPFPDASFDLAVCFHVLEHIPDDASAVRELSRVLGPDGQAVVVVPFAEWYDETFEDPDTPPEDRKAVYGQSDHVRVYGMDVASRWRGMGVELDETMWDERFSPEEHETARLKGRDDRFFLLLPSAAGT